jgi:hypothetical protein
MNNQHGLLPWILGGLSVATVAVVITVASAGKTVAPGLSPVGSTTAQVTSAPDSPSFPAPAAEATAAAEPAVAPAPASVPDPEAAPTPTAQTQPSVDPAVQSGQIWECVTNGVKTFSNNPCGEKSSLLEVRAINTMNPTPVVRYARTNAPEPRYSPGYADQNTDSDQEVYGEQGAETAVNSYTVVQGLAFLPRRRPDRPHHRPPFHHNLGDNPGDNPGHHPGHNPGPPRRN